MPERRQFGFTLRVRPECLDEYRRRHEHVWPEMREALTEAGWHNYSLFLREDGLLFGYVEATDFQAILDAMAATDVNARWQAEMAPFFLGEEGKNADEQMKLLDQIFFLP